MKRTDRFDCRRLRRIRGFRRPAADSADYLFDARARFPCVTRTHTDRKAQSNAPVGISETRNILGAFGSEWQLRILQCRAARSRDQVIIDHEIHNLGLALGLASHKLRLWS